jgi:hypothetical protein
MSKFLSLEWFKSKIERAVENVISNKIENLIENSEEELAVKPYSNIKLTNNVLTIVLNNGDILCKPSSTVEDFKKAREAKTEDELLMLAASVEGLEEKRQQEKEVAKSKALLEGLEVLKNLDDFQVVENSVYLKGTIRTLPPLLVEKFIEIVHNNGFPLEQVDLDNHEEYVSLKRFFLWCCLNPRAEVADKLYDFLTRNKMRITKQGLFVGLRNVKKVAGNNHELVDFITNAYQKVKAVWKKKPSDFFVWGDDDGTLTFSKDGQPDGINKLYGNLQDLYLDLPNMKENRYTDGWTQTFDIRIGKPVKMDPKDCNWSTQDCATAGLHFAGHTSPYVLYGDTTVFTLHNPMKVVGIGSEKGRCYEYLPFMTTTVNEADQIMNSGDFDFLELDEQYAIDELNDLENRVKEGFAKEAMKYEFNIPQISITEIRNIISSLDEIKETISNRIKTVD